MGLQIQCQESLQLKTYFDKLSWDVFYAFILFLKAGLLFVVSSEFTVLI